MKSSPRPVATTSASSHLAHVLLARAHSPDIAACLFSDKVLHKPLLLRASSPPTPADKRTLRRHVRLKKKEYYLRKQKPRPLSAREKRVLGVHDLENEEIKYEIYEELNRLWGTYIREVLGIGGGKTKCVTPTGHGALLASADFHGAEVEVVQCGCVGRVGTKGIVVRDTKFTFILVCKGDVVRRLPKKDTVFRVQVPLVEDDDEENEKSGQEGKRNGKGEPKKLTFDLHGNQLEFRSAERANRKFKWSMKDYL